MPDHAHSRNPAVQCQLDRLWSLSPGADVLGLDRISALLARIGDPHHALPPVFHVAGTNGKGSTCAFLRAALEAAGYRVHAYTSPHLVRFNERIRLAGRLIEDAALAPLLAEILDAGSDIGASFFEVTTAAAFLAFARTPADACVIEVGLGGRLDATNVLPAPVVCGIAALGIDHQSFLGDTLIEIASEKAGIAKPGIPLVTMHYSPEVAAQIAAVAARSGAPLIIRDRDWTSRSGPGTLDYTDRHGAVRTPSPAMAGAFQSDNLALAIAMLRHQSALALPDEALRTAARTAHWPARMQRLRPGPLVARLPPGRHGAVHVDGGHNVSAAQEIARIDLAGDGPLTIVIGMLANKDAAGVLALLAGRAPCHVVAIPVPGHEHHSPDRLAVLAHASGATAQTAPSIAAAFDAIATRGGDGAILVAGSLYLAGDALAANDELPD